MFWNRKHQTKSSNAHSKNLSTRRLINFLIFLKLKFLVKILNSSKWVSSSIIFILFWSFVKKCSKTTSIQYFIIILKINHKQKERKNFKILYFLTNFQQITQKSLWFTYIISLWKISKVQKKTYNLPTPIWLKKGVSFFYINQINNKKHQE